MRRNIPRRWAGGLLVLAFLAAEASLAAEQSACRDGSCEPHCPVRPGQYGYYPTQWRRWPVAERPAEKPRDTTTPATPPRSLVPDPDEESPPAAVAPAAAAAGPAAGRAVERLVAEADAARLTTPARRQEFTARLVSAMLTEHDPQSRCVVLEVAAGFDTPAAEAICSGALEDPDPRVRLVACRVCAARGGPDNVARLARRAREDADLGVRLRAVRTLGDVGDPAAIPHLVALLDDPDPAMQARAAAALGRATGQGFGADVARWKEWAAHSGDLPPRWSLGSTLRGLF